jgi:hypothetical protein
LVEGKRRGGRPTWICLAAFVTGRGSEWETCIASAEIMADAREQERLTLRGYVKYVQEPRVAAQ